ncbi:MAG: hypothetical protein EWV92_02235 [Microcystis aeruginosa Ma_MB_S_20031200_S102]|uniref:Uncharacterized protein n=1 Tax=Microcystis aeruginosa Ma_MB_S_20031200_S102 TaxID=2486254 RepID=A0A552F5U9_MICAE|nr:MAG: hypothetical protein EWV92_02235 [Microcystis aeruginosa Ma_MB_S_20031200_S102]
MKLFVLIVSPSVSFLFEITITLFLSNYLRLRMYENASIGQKLNDAFLSSKNCYSCNPKQINSDWGQCL